MVLLRISPESLKLVLKNFRLSWKILFPKRLKEQVSRHRRLSLYLFRKYGVKISENTIKSILKRNAVPRKTRKTKKGERSLYDYEALIPFPEFQLDTKYLAE